MRGLLPGLSLVLLCSATLVAQNETVRRDTMFPVEVEQTVKSKDVRIGDSIELKLESGVLIGNNIVAPQGAKIFGEVLQAWNDATGKPRSLLRIRFHTLKWKDHEIPLNAVVSSIVPGHVAMYGLSGLPIRPTFMEDIRVLSHLRRVSSTEFQSDDKSFSIRSGVRFVLRQIDPEMYPRTPDIEVGVEAPKQMERPAPVRRRWPG